MSAFSRTASITLGAALVAAPFALTTVAANAVSSTCGGVSGAVQVLPNVCEIGYQAAGEYSFTTPAGMTKMAAVLVGGGGGSWTATQEAYGGGGGGVEYVDLSSATNTTFTITPGAGGEAGGGNGEDSTLSWGTEEIRALGGDGAVSDQSGDSGGAGLGLFGYNGASGGGASGDGSQLGNNSPVDPGTFASGGAGLRPSSLPGVSTTLFQSGVNDFEFGVGGSALYSNLTTEISLNTDAYYANAGYGGNAIDTADAVAGNDGAIYIRWTTVADPTESPALASTGANTTTPIALGIGSVALGSVLIANGLRVRSARRSK